MLTSEERQRIEAEEQKRAAEEQYRAQVRTSLTPAPRPTKPANPLPWIVLAILAVAALFTVGNIVWSNLSRAKQDGLGARVEKTRIVPTSQKITSGQIQVNARAFKPYKIEITPDMSQPTLVGSFTASGWGGNDIVVAIMSGEENFTNWTNGHKAQVLWQTDGQQTTGKFSVTLAPGVNYLVVSNQVSAIMNRQVSLDIDLNFQKVETYYE